MNYTILEAFNKILSILKFEKKEVGAIYFYSILSGIVQLSVPLGIQSILSFVMGGSISASLILLITFVVLGVLLNGWLQVSQMRIIEQIQQKLFIKYALWYSFYLPKLNLKKSDAYYLPELINRFFDVSILQKGLAKLLLDIPVAVLQIIFGIILLSFYHPAFLAFGVLLITLLFMILKYTSKHGFESSIEESNYKYEVAGWLEEQARAVQSFKFSKQNWFHLKKTDSLVMKYLNARTTHFKILQFQYWCLVFFKVIITALMLIVGSYLLIDQKLNIGQFIAAELVILMVITSIEKIIINLDNVYDVLTSVEKLAKLTEKPIERNGEFELDVKNGINIQAKNLEFSYDSEFIHLKNLTFKIGVYEKVCLSGEYGSGKSTLLRLLTGAYQPFGGSIFINDTPLQNINLESYRIKIGTLFNAQDIFKGTLLENITLGDEAIPPSDIFKLIEDIGFNNFISDFTNGLNENIEPLGIKLPQRIVKKILILRALIGNPYLLLLEEPWLGLDMHDELMLKKYLIEKTPKSTIIVASNDKSFANQCHQNIKLSKN